MTTKKTKTFRDPYDSEFGADAIKPEDLSDLTEARKNIRRKHGGKDGGKDSQRKAHELVRKYFIDDLFYAHDEGKAILPKELASRLEKIVVYDWLGGPLPAGRPIGYTDAEKSAFVQRTHELRNTGLTIEKACRSAAEELFDNRRRPNSGTYSKWMKVFDLPYQNIKYAKKSAPKVK